MGCSDFQGLEKNASSIWYAIVSVRDVFFPHIRYKCTIRAYQSISLHSGIAKMGMKGDQIIFWKDIWYGNAQ